MPTDDPTDTHVVKCLWKGALSSSLRSTWFGEYLLSCHDIGLVTTYKTMNSKRVCLLVTSDPLLKTDAWAPGFLHAPR